MSIVIRGSASGAVVAALAALVTSLTTPSAEAVTLVWQNAAGGPAGVAANWNPAQVRPRPTSCGSIWPTATP